MTPVPDSALGRIPGWFPRDDAALFRFFLGHQTDTGVRGDLAELGAYMGKSAVLIGGHVAEDEVFTVIDLFDDLGGTDDANSAENHAAYDGLTLEGFVEQYRSVHPDLPVVIQGPSSSICEHARLGAHRFVHVDASHLYHHVREDIESAHALLGDDGVVVLDDFRSPHTPGVAAAAWQAVLEDGLHPLVVTNNKLYGTWGQPAPWQLALRGWLPTSGMRHEEQRVANHALLRAWFTPTALDRWLPPALMETGSRVRRATTAGLRRAVPPTRDKRTTSSAATEELAS